MVGDRSDTFDQLVKRGVYGRGVYARYAGDQRLFVGYYSVEAAAKMADQAHPWGRFESTPLEEAR